MPAGLKRELGLPDAVLLGLGSILGTGVFVSIAIGAGVAGPAVLLSIVLAGLLALCNALSSAQLAASHPVSGGTYEYGYRYLSPKLGFSAGWLFLCAKSASAATAALGISGYLLRLSNGPLELLVPLALGMVVAVTLLACGGLKRSSRVNTCIVSLTLLSLGILVLMALTHSGGASETRLTPFLPFSRPQEGLLALLQSTALMFVAYTGYGRIATLGEEVHDPQSTIPKAILGTLGVSVVLYVAVGFAALSTVGAEELSRSVQNEVAPLETVAQALGSPTLRTLVSVGAMTAMLGVLLNLLLGLSRVLIAMGRRGDLPSATAKLNSSGQPSVAVLSVGALVGLLTLLGSVQTTWSFSAFTVLIYYAITNLACLKLPETSKKYPRGFSWVGLVGCLLLSFWVETQVWFAGLSLLAIGLIYQKFCTPKHPVHGTGRPFGRAETRRRD